MIIEDKLMRYILYKKRTINEVRNKCKLLKYEENYIDNAITYLEEAGYINDEIYVEKYISTVKKLKHMSRNEIRIDLMRRGIEDYLIDNALQNEEINEFELVSAEYILQKKLKSGDEIEKIKKFLLNKGYSYSNVSKAIDNWKDMNDN